MLGNYLIGEKIHASDFEKFVGCIDLIGVTAFLGSAIGLFMMRQKIRQKDGMPQAEICDFCSVYCCLPCAICQTANHIGLDKDDNEPGHDRYGNEL